MKKVLILLGNITFENDGAIVHGVDDILRIEEDKAEEIADSLVNLYDAYLIPALFKGKIKWDCEKDFGDTYSAMEVNDSVTFVKTKSSLV